MSISDHNGFIQLPFHTAYLKHLLGELLPVFVDLLNKRKVMKIIFLILEEALLCQRTGSKRMMQTNAALARFQILLVAEDPKRAPTGLGNSTDCGARD